MKRRHALTLATVTALIACGCDLRKAARFAPDDRVLAVTASTNQVALGQTVRIEARLRAEPSDQCRWPMAGAPPALVQRETRESTRSVGGRSFRSRTIELLALRPGRYELWTGTVVRTSANGTQTHVELPAQFLEVIATLEPQPPPAIRDIAGVLRWPDPRWKKLAAAVAAVVLIAGAVAWWIRGRAGRRVEPPPAPRLPPHEKALRALAALRARGWPDEREVEAFYVELSAIVRTYLEEALNLRAPEQTTEEFIRTASASRALNPEQQQRVIQFLEQSDLVKFARYQPLQSDMENALAAAHRLIEDTRPRPPPPPP